MGEMVRLQKYIALCGVASRRHAEEMIAAGRVQVDGTTVNEQGTKVEIGANRVWLDGKEIKPVKKKYYIMLNKPYGYISAVTDQFDRPTVTDLVSDEVSAQLYPVGRLDYDTEGLILLTNDGDFTYHITHPKHNVGKTYVVTVKGGITVKHLQILRRGLKIEDYVTAPAQVEILDSIPGQSCLQITIHEGKNRQVRRMMETLGFQVLHLKRTAIGKVELGNLQLGKWRHLTATEVTYLLKEHESI